MERLQKFGRYSKRVINRLTKREEESDEDADWNFTSYINGETRSVSWCIENINCCPLETGKYYESPSFCTGFSTEEKWALRLYPKGRKDAEKIGIFIHKISENSRPDLRMQYLLQVKLISESREDSKEKEDIYSFRNPGKTLEEIDEKVESREYGTDGFIPNTYLLRKKSITVFCSLNVIYMDGENESSIAGPSTSLILYDDLKELYKRGTFSDVTLQVGKKSFPAHKAILAARSKVFAAMFDHDMKETKTNVITIEDVEPSVMNCVLQYIYTGKVETLTMEEAVNMFSVADKYSLDELQKWCVRVMLAKLSVDNVCRIAILADMHSVPKLKTASNCLIRKYLHEIVTKKEWKKILRDRPRLASDILEAVSSDFNTNLKS